MPKPKTLEACVPTRPLGISRHGVGCDRRCKAIVGGRILPGAGKSGESEKAADPKAGGVNVASGDDAPAGARFIGVDGDGLVGFEMHVALERKAEFAAHGAKLDETHVAEFHSCGRGITENENDLLSSPAYGHGRSISRSTVFLSTAAGE